MGKKKRQFIDKKKAHKFTLVHRSQRDPLQADEGSAQKVLIPVGEAPVDNSEGAAGFSNSEEEQVKYGIYFEDDYNYMQHIKPRGEGMLVLADDVHKEQNIDNNPNEKVSFGNVLLPSEALPSKYEEDVGMLNKGVLPRGPQPDLDPDIVAALDDGIDLDDPDNILEDDFMNFANAVPSEHANENDQNEEFHIDEGEWETESEGSEGSYIDSDNLLSDEEFDDSEEEIKSRFTNYSMTSSVIRRTQGLKLLDDRFERIMEEYDEEELGCIDYEDVAGTFDLNNELVTQVVDEFIDKQKTHAITEVQNCDDDQVDNELENVDSGEEKEEQLFAQFKKEPKEKWDCESIISSYSNIYNHPKLIIEDNKPKKVILNKHTGIPVGILNDKAKNTEKEKNDDGMCDQVILNNIRNKSETAEEKKSRKQEVKQQRKDRRAERKSNKLAFKDEMKKQEKIVLNTVVQKGIKM